MIHAVDLVDEHRQQRAVSSMQARLEDDLSKFRELVENNSYIKPEHAVGDLLDTLHQADLYVRIIARNRWGLGI
jgi:hypothetical protein